MKITYLTVVEEQLMMFLWTLKSFYMKDVMELHPEPKPHQNTISTYLKILQEKGFLNVAKEGRIHKYSTAIPIEEYKKHILKELIQKFYNNNGVEILHHLFDEKLISQQDLMPFINLKIELKPAQEEIATYPIAEKILKKKKEKEKDEKKKKKKKKK